MALIYYFAYIETNGQVYPQKWHGPQTVGGKEQENIVKYQITAEELELSFDDLMAKYPYKKRE